MIIAMVPPPVSSQGILHTEVGRAHSTSQVIPLPTVLLEMPCSVLSLSKTSSTSVAMVVVFRSHSGGLDGLAVKG